MCSGWCWWQSCVCRFVWPHFDFDLNRSEEKALVLAIGPPTEPPNCSRSKRGTGCVRSNVAGKAWKFRLRSNRNAEP